MLFEDGYRLKRLRTKRSRCRLRCSGKTALLTSWACSCPTETDRLRQTARQIDAHIPCGRLRARSAVNSGLTANRRLLRFQASISRNDNPRPFKLHAADRKRGPFVWKLGRKLGFMFGAVLFMSVMLGRYKRIAFDGATSTQPRLRRCL